MPHLKASDSDTGYFGMPLTIDIQQRKCVRNFAFSFTCDKEHNTKRRYSTTPRIINSQVSCISYSSYGYVKSHNWSAKQQLHRQQSVVATSRHFISSEDTSRQCGTSIASHHRDSDQWLPDSVCFLRGTAVTLCSPKTVVISKTIRFWLYCKHESVARVYSAWWRNALLH